MDERRYHRDDGPEDPMLEKRVENLESTMRSIETALVEIKTELKHLPKMSDYMGIKSDFASLKSDVAEIKGRLSNTPTTLQLLAMIISTWTAGAAIVFAIARFGLR